MVRPVALYIIEHTVSKREYVGISADPEMRWTEHRRKAVAGKRAKLYKAMRKHGATAFRMLVVKWFDSREAACAAEIAAIRERVPHFNTTAGGDGGDTFSGRQHTHATKLKMSAAMRGIKRTPEGCANNAAAQRGKRLSAEHVRKSTECLRGRKREHATSRFIGVGWHAQRGAWRARCTVKAHRGHLGLFQSEEAAARAYDEYARPRGLPTNALTR